MIRPLKSLYRNFFHTVPSFTICSQQAQTIAVASKKMYAKVNDIYQYASIKPDFYPNDSSQSKLLMTAEVDAHGRLEDAEAEGGHHGKHVL